VGADWEQAVDLFPVAEALKDRKSGVIARVADESSGELDRFGDGTHLP
jgi:hypothetical protein